LADIDDVIRSNLQGLRDLEGVSPSNHQRLKDFVTKRRQEMEGLNDDLPEIEDIGR
jgi:hypothetical protein